MEGRGKLEILRRRHLHREMEPGRRDGLADVLLREREIELEKHGAVLDPLQPAEDEKRPRSDSVRNGDRDGAHRNDHPANRLPLDPVGAVVDELRGHRSLGIRAAGQREREKRGDDPVF